MNLLFSLHNNKNIIHLLILLPLLLILIYFIGNNNYKPDYVVKKTKLQLNKYTLDNEKSLDEIEKYLKVLDTINREFLFKKFKNYNKYLLIYKDKTLLYWNTIKLPDKIIKNIGFVKDTSYIFDANDNWYLITNRKTNKYFLKIIKPIYPYLSNVNGPYVFNKSIFCKGKNLIKFNNSFFCIKKVNDSNTFNILLIYLLYFYIYFIILQLIYIVFKSLISYKKSKWIYFFLFVITVFLIRLIDYYFVLPRYIKYFPIFYNKISIIFLFNSVGDIILNLLVIYIILKSLQFIKDEIKSFVIEINFLINILIPFGIFFIFFIMEKYLIEIGFNFSFKLLPLNLTFILTLFVVVFSNFIIYLFVKFSYFENKKQKLSIALLIRLIPVVLILICEVLFNFSGTIVILSIINYLFYSLFLHLKKIKNISSYFYTFYIILLMALSGSYIINITDYARKDKSQIFTKNYLSQTNDPLFEYKIKSILNKIQNDTIIRAIVFSKTDTANEIIKLHKYIIKHYLIGLDNFYKFQITLCKNNELLEIQPEAKLVNCVDYFKSMPGNYIFDDSLLNLRLIKSDFKSIYYIADIDFNNFNKKSSSPHLILEFLKEKIQSGIGYTDLLNPNNRFNTLNLKTFNFAVYDDDIITYKFGDFLYPVVYKQFKKFTENTFIRWNGYIHYITTLNDKNKKLVVSRRQKSLSYILFPFNFLFVLLFIIVLLNFIIKSFKGLKSKSILNYSNKIQLIYFLSFIVIFSLISTVSIYYINLSNRRAIENELEEKTQSISLELQHKFAKENRFTFNKQKIEKYLKKLSNIFFTDINLYDNNGKLIVSSRPIIFTTNLQATLMNPIAFNELKYRHILFFIDKEKINNVSFYSSYLPLVLENGILFGFVNLPYFAKENDLLKNKNLLFVSFFNLLVFIAILILAVSYFVTRMITKPLEVLQTRIKDTDLEEKLVKIKWNRNDEIGQLVKAYNEMVEKLKYSAELLKKSERELAWREMAQQIAHEIRNPLTPMKLNIQYLMKARNENDPDFDEKLKNISDTLITQIEVLNNVASMFSDFSKLKSEQNKIFDLKNVALKAISLFKNNKNIRLTFYCDKESRFIVKGDERDFLRIFNNLIKNAIQSFETDRVGQVEIKMSLENNMVLIIVRDDGPGISESIRDKIFKPYFTTKSKGTGIGLAIVYNLVKELGGSIYFETETGKGTQFFLRFPISNNTF